MTREGECDNCTNYGVLSESKVREFGIEDTLWLCEECGGFDASDYQREQDKLDEEEVDEV